MKHLKIFEGYPDVPNDDAKFKNHVINGSKPFKEIPDNRETAKEGDVAIAIWYPEEEWYAFKLEKLDDGLGFSGANGIGETDTVYNLKDAYHAIILK